MLTYSFSDEINAHTGKKTPLYEQLYDFIRSDILSGKLKGGEKLPSKRNFAKNLAVSTITVETAYDNLLSEGYIYSVEKRGYFISEDISSSLLYASSLGTEEKSKEETQGENTFTDLNSNTANASLFPFSTWAHITRKVMAEKREELLQSSSSGGTEELKQAIARHLSQFRALDIDEQQIIIGAGTEYLYSLIIQLLGYEHTYALEEPGYQKISRIYAAHRVETAHIELDREGISIAELKKSSASIVHISPSHHFPTGCIMTIARRYELLEWADEESDRYIIEDDYDSELRFDSRPIPSLQSIDKKGKVIYINTFSKTLSSTIRVSYMVLPKHLVDVFYSKLGFYSNTVPVINQYVLASFMSSGHFEKHINRLRQHYKDLRNYFLTQIQQHLRGAEVKDEVAGLHFLLHIATDKSDEELKRAAKEKGVLLSCLSDYYFDKAKAKEHIIVVNYSSLDKAQIQSAVSILSHII